MQSFSSMKSISGSRSGHENKKVDSLGGAFDAVGGVNPRWLLLNRWTQVSPSVKSLPQDTDSPHDASPAISPLNRRSPSSFPIVRFSSSLGGSDSLKITDFFSRSTAKSPVQAVSVLPSPVSSYPTVAESQVHPKGKASEKIVLSPPVVNHVLPSDFDAHVPPPLRGTWKLGEELILLNQKNFHLSLQRKMLCVSLGRLKWTQQ